MAGAPLGTRTAAKQSESKSKLMPNLFESRGLRRLWASHGQSGSYRFVRQIGTDKRASLYLTSDPAIRKLSRRVGAIASDFTRRSTCFGAIAQRLGARSVA